MDECNVYDRKLFKDKMIELYNNNNYNFIINNNKLNNFISQWKIKSNKFDKNSIFDNIEDKNGNLILKDYRIFYKYDKDKRKPQKYEYVIWGNNQNLIRICKSNIWFLDGTFHHPDNFKQVLILMYKDYLTGEKIPGLYILMNKINSFLYDIIFDSIVNIITQNNSIPVNVKFIISDSEIALNKSIKNKFNEVKRIGCYYHYKKNLLKNIKEFGLYNSKFKIYSDIVIKKLGLLPLLYNGNMSYFYNYLDNLKKEYPYYINYINNYYIKYYSEYFKNNEYNYNILPEDCKSNSFIENYNKYIKNKLGNKKLVNWYNFISFIKEESLRIIDKLNITDELNFSYNLKNTKFSTKYSSYNLSYKNDKNNNDIINEKKEINIKNNNPIEISSIISKSLIGLNNLSNTCYMNCILSKF